MIDYYLASDAGGETTLEIKDAKGNVVRRYASTDKIPAPDPKELRIPPYWLRPPQPLSAAPGLHRFLWDMHLPPIAGVEPEYPIAAIYRNTAPNPTSPWAMPGGYTAVLTANGKSYTQPLALKMDPRVKATAADLARQFDLSKKLYDLRGKLEPIGNSFVALNTELGKAKERAGAKPVAQQIDALTSALVKLAPQNARPGQDLTLDVLSKAQSLFAQVHDVDAAPRPVIKTAVTDVLRDSDSVLQRWETIVSQELPALNQQLEAAGVEKIALKESAR